MKIDIIYALGIGAFLLSLLFAVFLQNWQNVNIIKKLQQKAVDEEVAVWYTSPKGEKGIIWMSDLFQETIAQK